MRAAPDRKDNDKSLSLVSDYLHVTLQSNKSFPLRPPEWESGSGSAQAGAQSTSGHRGKNANTRIKIYRDVLDRCQEYQSAKSRYWNIQSLEVWTDNPHIRRESCGDDLRGEQSLPGGQAGGGGAGGCGGGVTCHVSRWCLYPCRHVTILRQVTTRVYRHRSVHSTTAREMIGAVMLWYMLSYAFVSVFYKPFYVTLIQWMLQTSAATSGASGGGRWTGRTWSPPASTWGTRPRRSAPGEPLSHAPLQCLERWRHFVVD